MVREFGPAEMRKRRYILETSNPHMLEKDERYKKIMGQMAKQNDINNS